MEPQDEDNAEEGAEGAIGRSAAGRSMGGASINKTQRSMAKANGPAADQCAHRDHER